MNREIYSSAIIASFVLTMVITMAPYVLSQDNETSDESDRDAEGDEGVGYGIIVGFVIGVSFFFFLSTVWYLFDKRKKRMERAFLLLFNPIQRSINSAGRFIQIRRNIRIPVSDSEEKVFWAVETDNVVILPAYGEQDDLIIEDERRVPQVKIMVAEIIGLSRDGEDAQKEWAKYAFPSSVFHVPPQLASVPPNYVFVRPIYKREWGPIILRKGLAAVRNVFGEIIRMKAVSDREQEILNENWIRMISTSIQSANEIIISMYYNALQLWDTISEHRVLPWEVLGRLVHQPMDQLNFTGLQQAIQSGNIREIGTQIIRSYRRALDSMADEFGLTMMSEPVAKALMGRLNDMQHKLGGIMKRDYQSQQAGMQQLIDMVKSNAQQPPRPQMQARPQAPQLPQNSGSRQSRPNERPRPVVNMYEE